MRRDENKHASELRAFGCPAYKKDSLSHSEISLKTLFFMRATLTEHEHWIILCERRGSTASPGFHVRAIAHPNFAELRPQFTHSFQIIYRLDHYVCCFSSSILFTFPAQTVRSDASS